MFKLRVAALIAPVALAAATGAPAAMLGPDPAACAASAAAPAALVRVTGFKNRAGTVRVRAFPADTPYLFDKRGAVARIEAPVPAAGAVEVCVPLPHPGSYAFDVRHDADGNGETGMHDGGGMSGNPHYSAAQALMRSKPPVDRVAVAIGSGVAVVPVLLNYFQGLSFGPIAKGGPS